MRASVSASTRPSLYSAEKTAPVRISNAAEDERPPARGDERVDARAPAADAKASCGQIPAATPRMSAAVVPASFLRGARSSSDTRTRAEAVGDNLHGVVRRARGGSGGVQRDRGAEHDAELVVGVVPGKLRAPRRADQKRVRRIAERPEIFFTKPRVA